MKVFSERQRFTQSWLWVLLAVCFGIAFIEPAQQIFAKDAIALSDLSLGLWIGPVVVILAMLFLRSLVLETEINENGIAYQFGPFHREPKRINWNELEKAYVRAYRPLSEYGGWGYRVGFSGGAYNIKGNQGIQLKFKSGKKLLLGTQKPKEAQQVIEKYFEYERI